MTQLICLKCGLRFSSSEVRWKCDCGGLLDIDFTPRFNRRIITASPASLWRYREALPLEDDNNIVSLGEGCTPLTRFQLGGREVLVKQDHLFPSGSYKDRGAALLISKAKELGVREVVEDSSGNAGCAIAAWCAKAAMVCQIFVPDSTSPGKTAQIEMYGGKMNLIPGSREDTAHAVLAAAEHYYYASHSWNPFFLHGTKTWAFEVWEQLGWKAPDTIILPVGNGTLLLGASIGFRELLDAGEIRCAPKIIAVQSENSAPLAKAFHERLNYIPTIDKKDTLAEGIAIAEPVRGMQIIKAVRESGGDFITVSDAEVEKSLIEVCAQGAYIEPTSAATTAAAARYLGYSGADELVVTVFTGHGLKSTEKVMKILEHRRQTSDSSPL